jgi:glutamine amidotransferase PdxT
VSVDSAFYYSRTGFGMVDSVDIYYAAKLGMIPDSITLFWPGSDTGKRVIAGTSAEMTLAADSSHLTIVLANPFATEITASIASASSKQGISYDRPNNNPGVQETSSPFAIKDRVGPLVMAAQVVERIPAGTGIDTMYVSFSEDIKASSLVGNSLILIKNGVSTTISILAATATSKSSFKLTVSTPTPVFGPVAGDSLRIEPTGPITDALGNSANLLNRPVVITVKAVPASIVYGYYLDNYPAGRADGVVDSVVIKFNKNIGISDAIISLDWGSINTADSIPSSYMNYVGGDSSLIEINVRGRFKNIADDSIKTSGGMTATVLYRSIPGEPVQGSIADSAGPVAVDTAIYYPGVDSDSVYVTFSEPLASISQMNSPFNLWSITGASTYSLNISNTTLNKKGNKPTYLFNVKSIVSGNNNVKYPYTGDSLWINSNAGVTDNNGKVQTTGDNHKVPVNVKPIETQWDVTIDKNPYTPQNDSMSVKIVIQNVKMVQFAQISASGKIYDVLGNCIHVWEKRDFDPTGQSLELDLGWNGCNMQGRLVGSGVYIADINVTSDGKNSSKRKRIGVKR